MPPPGTLEERGPRGFRGGRRRPRRSQRRSHCGPLWLGEAEEEPGLATAPSWKGVLGRGTALRRWEAGPRMGGGAASCPRFSWWGTVGPSSGLSVVLSSDVFLPSASAHPISKLLRSFLREASLGFSDRGGSPAPACSAHLCRDASVCWFMCRPAPTHTHTHTLDCESMGLGPLCPLSPAPSPLPAGGHPRWRKASAGSGTCQPPGGVENWRPGHPRTPPCGSPASARF